MVNMVKLVNPLKGAISTLQKISKAGLVVVKKGDELILKLSENATLIIAKFDTKNILTNITWASDGTVINSLDNIKYLDDVGNIIEGSFSVIRKQDGSVGLKLAKAGENLSHFLDDAFVLSKRAEVIADGLPAKFPNLSIDELTSIKVYTSDEVRNGVKIYKTLNTQLRVGNLEEYYQGLNKLLNDGLNKLPRHNDNTVFRGIHGSEVTIADGWKKGGLVDFKDFKSSSTSIETAAYEFSYKQGYDVVLEIKNADGYNICNISCNPSEMEILLSSGQKFEVIDIIDNFQIYDPSYTQQNPFKKIILKITP